MTHYILMAFETGGAFPTGYLLGDDVDQLANYAATMANRRLEWHFEDDPKAMLCGPAYIARTATARYEIGPIRHVNTDPPAFDALTERFERIMGGSVLPTVSGG